MQTALVFALMSFHSLALIRRNKFTVEEQKGLDETQGKTTPSVSARMNASDMALGTSVSLDIMDVHNQNGNENENDDSSNTGDNAESVITPHSMCFGCLRINVPWWAYATFALISVESSYFTFLAYRYTTLPSAALLDNTNILAAMIASKIILKRRYSRTHILGAMICLIGVVFNLFSDFEQAGEDTSMIDDLAALTEAEEYPKKMLGDILAICGGFFVGLCDVLVEMIVKDYVTVDEYLGCVGIFGTIIASVQACILERSQIAKIFAPQSDLQMTTQEIYETYSDNPFDAPRSCSRDTALALVFGYAVTTYLFSYCLSRFLSVSESALLTLSLLTADLYSVIFTVVAEHIPPPGLFYLAFLLVLVGVIVYEMAPSPLGYAEDLQMGKGYEIERENLKEDFEMSNMSLSWDGEEDATKIKRREIL